MPHMLKKWQSSESGLPHLLKNIISLAELNKLLPEESNQLFVFVEMFDRWESDGGRGIISFNDCVTASVLIFALSPTKKLCTKQASLALCFFVYKIRRLSDLNLGSRNVSTLTFHALFSMERKKKVTLVNSTNPQNREMASYNNRIS